MESLQQEHSAPGVKLAARCHLDAVRLTHHRPGAADQPGGGARPEAFGLDRQDADPQGRRVAQAARFHSGQDTPRSARSALSAIDEHWSFRMREHFNRLAAQDHR